MLTCLLRILRSEKIQPLTYTFVANDVSFQIKLKAATNASYEVMLIRENQEK